MNHRFFGKRLLAVCAGAAVLCAMLSGCGGAVPKGSGSDVPLSSIEDVTDKNGKCTYEMVAEFTDSYLFSCKQASAISVRSVEGAQIVTGDSTAAAALSAGESYCIEVSTEKAEQSFSLEVQAEHHVQRLPYLPHSTYDETQQPTSDPSADPLTAAKISYTKREGGTYVYCNNPEKLADEDVGQALLRDEDLTGDVEFTFEHSNFSSAPFYLGYQLLNPGETDVFVTVQNIGLQVEGEWLGQKSWSDYYNRSFDLPEDYFKSKNLVDDRYKGQDFVNYTPRVFQPTTYRIPAGEYIYVLGGTSKDAYNRTNVAFTADQPIQCHRCANGVVKFHVSGGMVTGTFYCYTDAQQVQECPEEQGYIVDRNGTEYGLQYKGTDEHQGLIESTMVWTVNDNSPAGKLPVTYDVSFDPRATRTGKAYAAYKNITQTVEDTCWITNINPQGSHKAVGTDMMSFSCKTTDGEQIVIDNDHADGYGNVANTGNWMVDYHDNYTFVNDGDTPRTFTVQKRANGALMAMILDKDGEVLATKCTIIPLTEPMTEYNTKLYELTVAPHSTEQITVSFLLMGNSSGYVVNWVEME